MITLNTDINLLCKLFDINTQKLSTQYSGMSIEEIMKQEAASGNKKAANFDAEILTNPYKLIQLFKLDDVGNKYSILSNMNQDDLENLLPYLDQKDLVTGLNYFNKDKLMQLLTDLPKEQLLNLVFQMFSPAHLMSYMPDDQLNKVLTSTQMDKNTIEKYLPSLNPQILAQMLQAAGQNVQTEGQSPISGQVSLNQEKLITQISGLSDGDFKKAILGMPPTNKQEFVYKLTNANNELYKEIDSDAYVNIINKHKDKADILRYADAISPDQLVKMVSQLPKELTSVVLTQLDTKKFADVLQTSFKDILKQIVAG